MSIKDISELDMSKYTGFHTCMNLEESRLYIILHDKRWWWPNKSLSYPRTISGEREFFNVRAALREHFG